MNRTNYYEGKDKLSFTEKVRLAGAIWIYGSINIKRERKRRRYYPRIVLSMPNPLPIDYANDTGGRVYAGKRDGYFTLIIGRQERVEKRLREILPYIGGEERTQIEIALRILDIKHSKMSKIEKNQELEILYAQWKESQNRLEKWIKDFKAKSKDMEIPEITADLQKIWSKAYVWEDY